MRQLQTDDMFLLSEIVDKMDLTIDPKGKSQEELGAELIVMLARRVHRAKDEIKALVAELTGKSPEEVGAMPPGEMIEAVKQIISQDGVLDFFKSRA